jgi:hypothetical protein
MYETFVPFVVKLLGGGGVVRSSWSSQSDLRIHQSTDMNCAERWIPGPGRNPDTVPALKRSDEMVATFNGWDDMPEPSGKPWSSGSASTKDGPPRGPCLPSS